MKTQKNKSVKSEYNYAEYSENTPLNELLFGDNYRGELKEITKHEIVVKIAEMLGPSPMELGKAEKIFDKMKYIIANYIINHEYNPPRGVSAELLLWLDSQSDPVKSRKLNKFISKYFREIE